MEISISENAIDGTAADDLAVSRALLDRVAAGEIDGALRIWRPVPAVAFSKLDLLLSPGAGDAVALTERAGLAAIQRMSGGHAVVLGELSLCAGVAETATAFEGTQERYELMRGAIVAALAAIGMDAEPGELPREWCPGAWSIHAGPVKLAGLSQRVISGAAWTEAVIQLGADVELYERIYETLGLPLDSATIASSGQLADLSALSDALVSALRMTSDGS